MGVPGEEVRRPGQGRRAGADELVEPLIRALRVKSSPRPPFTRDYARRQGAVVDRPGDFSAGTAGQALDVQDDDRAGLQRSQPRAAKSASALFTVSRDAPTSWASSSWVRSWTTWMPSSACSRSGGEVEQRLGHPAGHIGEHQVGTRRWCAAGGRRREQARATPGGRARAGGPVDRGERRPRSPRWRWPCAVRGRRGTARRSARRAEDGQHVLAAVGGGRSSLTLPSVTT